MTQKCRWGYEYNEEKQDCIIQKQMKATKAWYLMGLSLLTMIIGMILFYTYLIPSVIIISIGMGGLFFITWMMGEGLVEYKAPFEK